MCGGVDRTIMVESLLILTDDGSTIIVSRSGGLPMIPEQARYAADGGQRGAVCTTVRLVPGSPVVNPRVRFGPTRTVVTPASCRRRAGMSVPQIRASTRPTEGTCARSYPPVCLPPPPPDPSCGTIPRLRFPVRPTHTVSTEIVVGSAVQAQGVLPCVAIMSSSPSSPWSP